MQGFGVDPQALQAAGEDVRAIADRCRDVKLPDSGQIEAAVSNSATEHAVATVLPQLDAATEVYAEQEDGLADLLISTAVEYIEVDSLVGRRMGRLMGIG